MATGTANFIRRESLHYGKRIANLIRKKEILAHISITASAIASLTSFVKRIVNWNATKDLLNSARSTCQTVHATAPATRHSLTYRASRLPTQHFGTVSAINYHLINGNGCNISSSPTCQSKKLWK